MRYILREYSLNTIHWKKTTTYFVKYFGISPLSITLFCTIKLMQKCIINLTIIINATIGIKQITYILEKILTYLLNCNKRLEKNIRDNDSSGETKQLLK